MKSIQKAIFVEWRRPKTKQENEYYGLTEYENSYVAKVFINTKGSKKHLIDTFFHEMAHVFFAFHKSTKKMHSNKEEALATAIGRSCAAILK